MKLIRIKIDSISLLAMCFILLLVLGCGRKTDEQAMLECIEKLWQMSDEYPLDAYRQSIHLQDSVQGMSEYVRMKYELLHVRLMDKQDYVPASVDSIKNIMEFFEKNGNEEDVIRSYHYMSSVCRDLHDCPRAIVYDLQALDKSKTLKEKDSLMLMHIYSNLCGMYVRTYNMDEALRMAMEYLNMFPDDAWAMMDVASSYASDNDSVTAKRYFDMAYEILSHDTSFCYPAGNHAELLSVYTKYGEKEKAQRLRQILDKLDEKEQPYNYNLAMAEYYRRYVSADSAMLFYMKDYETSERVAEKYGALSELMNYYYRKGDFPKAAEYAVKFKETNDIVVAERKFEMTRNAHAEYRYLRDKDKESRMMRDNARMERIILIGIVSFLALGFVGYVYYSRRRRKLEATIYDRNIHISKLKECVSASNALYQETLLNLKSAKEELDGKRLELAKMLSVISAKQHELMVVKEKLARKELEIVDYESSISDLDNRIIQLKQSIEGKSKLNKELIKDYLNKSLIDMDVEVLDIFEKSPTHRVRMTEVQWKRFLANMDLRYPQFKECLEEKVPRLNTVLIRTAYLMKAGLTNQQIESIMTVSRQTNWERTKKLERYIGDMLEPEKAQ